MFSSIVKRSGLLIAVALVAVLSASASVVNCASATGVVTYGVANTDSFFCGDVVFSNFVLNEVSGGAGSVTITGADYNTVTGQVVLDLDPGLVSDQDDLLTYQAASFTGFKITGLDAAIGGADAAMDERACMLPVPTNGPNAFLCPNGSMLGEVAVNSGDPDMPVFSSPFGYIGPVYVVKDIDTGLGGSESVVDQSFEVANDTPPAPEPATLLLLGGGLLGLGLWKRRSKVQ
jgi:hypothetical protein